MTREANSSHVVDLERPAARATFITVRLRDRLLPARYVRQGALTDGAVLNMRLGVAVWAGHKNYLPWSVLNPNELYPARRPTTPPGMSLCGLEQRDHADPQVARELHQRLDGQVLAACLHLLEVAQAHPDLGRELLLRQSSLAP